MSQNSIEQIEDQALNWIMRSTSGTMTPEQAQAFQQWLAQNPAHQCAYAEARQLWEGLGALRERPIVADNLAQMATETKSLPRSTAQQTAPAKFSKRRVKQRQLNLAAACLALAAVLFPTAKDALRLWNAEYHTGIGEQKTLILADGSSVYLNAASAFNTRFSPAQRRIELLSGEAEFQVSKDPGRPFIVVVDQHEIKALGTDFVVKKTEQGIKVSVVESAVQVSQPDRTSLEQVVLHAGEQVNIPTGQRPDPVTEINTHHASSWRMNRLIFESEPLNNVIAEINRYRPGHVFLSHPSLEQLSVSGVFNIQEIDSLLAVIGKTLQVKAVTLGERYLVLY